MKFLKLAAATAAMIVGLAAGPATPPAAAAEAQPTQKLTVLLDWFLNPDHAPLVIAQEQGYFREAGLEVELVAPADPSDPPKLVAAGRGDIAISYQPELHLQVAAGLPLVRIGTLVATPLNTIIVSGNGPVKQLADLKGRKVGFSVSGFEDALLKAMLGHVGLSGDDIELINVNFALSAALLSGQVDAVIGGYRNFELNQMEIEGHPGRAFFPEEYGVPAYDELVILANSGKLDDPRLRPFIDAVERGVLYLVNNPEEGWELFRKGRPDVDNELNHKAWYDTLPRFAHSPGGLDEHRYERFARFLKDQGLIKETPPVSTYAAQLR